MAVSAAERFMDKVSPEPNSGCWLWTGGLTTSGYASFGPGCGMPPVKGHRWAYENFIGPIVEIPGIDSRGTCVLHSCDVRSCVNPDHLRLGTHRDNIDDKYARRRHGGPYGEDVNTAKLTADDVRRIRSLNGEVSVSDLAKEYDVHKTTIYALLNGVTWKTLK